jgi:soluble lytic murein transglycosylase-like protein
MNELETSDSVEANSTPLLPFENEIERAANEQHIPAALIAGIIQEESRFDAWAERVELAYQKNVRVRHAAAKWAGEHANTPSYQTELTDRSRSMGLMQVMGEVAREQGFTARYLSQLFEPAHSIAEGSKLLRTLLDRYPGDTLAAISAYNQGSARRKHSRSSRYKRGAFLNARYVYRVVIAWRAYKRLFDIERGRNDQ